MHQRTVNASELMVLHLGLLGAICLGKIPLLIEGYVLFRVQVGAVGLLGNYRYHVERSRIIQQNKINKRKQSIRIRALLLDANNNSKEMPP